MHTSAMKTSPNGTAPSGTRYRMGAKGGVVARAWQYVWDRLSTTEHRDAILLADEAAEKFGIKAASVRAHMYAMVREGVLETALREVTTTVTRYGKSFPAKRMRTFYRIRHTPESDS